MPTDLQNSFTATLSRFAIKKSLNIPPSFTHVATLPCKTVVLKNRKLRCRPIFKTFNDDEQLHIKSFVVLIRAFQRQIGQQVCTWTMRD